MVRWAMTRIKIKYWLRKIGLWTILVLGVLISVALIVPAIRIFQRRSGLAIEVFQKMRKIEDDRDKEIRKVNADAQQEISRIILKARIEGEDECAKILERVAKNTDNPKKTAAKLNKFYKKWKSHGK